MLSVREARARERGSLRIAEGHAGKPTSLAVVDDAGGKEVKVVVQGQLGPFAKGPLLVRRQDSRDSRQAGSSSGLRVRRLARCLVEAGCLAVAGRGRRTGWG